MEIWGDIAVRVAHSLAIDHEKICDAGKGQFKLEPCPMDKRIGKCVTPEGSKVYYSTGVLKPTVAKAEKWCKEGLPKGKWTPAK